MIKVLRCRNIIFGDGWEIGETFKMFLKFFELRLTANTRQDFLPYWSNDLYAMILNHPPKFMDCSIGFRLVTS